MGDAFITMCLPNCAACQLLAEVNERGALHGPPAQDNQWRVGLFDCGHGGFWRCCYAFTVPDMAAASARTAFDGSNFEVNYFCSSSEALTIALWFRPEHAYFWEGKTTYRTNISDLTLPVTWLFDPGPRADGLENSSEALSTIYIDLPKSPPFVANGSYEMIEDSAPLMITIRPENDPLNESELMITGLPTLGTLYNYDAKTKAIGDPIELEPRFEFIYQWASEVVNCSSQWYDPNGDYAVWHILGEPDAYPEYGDTPETWCPEENHGQRDFVHIRYEREVFVTSVIVDHDNLTFIIKSVPKFGVLSDAQTLEVVQAGSKLTGPQVVYKGECNWQHPSYITSFAWEASDGKTLTVGTTTLDITPIDAFSVAMWFRPEHAYFWEGKTTYRANFSDFGMPVTWEFDPAPKAFVMFETDVLSADHGGYPDHDNLTFIIKSVPKFGVLSDAQTLEVVQAGSKLTGPQVVYKGECNWQHPSYITSFAWEASDGKTLTVGTTTLDITCAGMQAMQSFVVSLSVVLPTVAVVAGVLLVAFLVHRRKQRAAIARMELERSDWMKKANALEQRLDTLQNFKHLLGTPAEFVVKTLSDIKNRMNAVRLYHIHHL
eukprot:m51a1_g691 hypothetical protein (604) ;mRNA; f:335645-344351